MFAVIPASHKFTLSMSGKGKLCSISIPFKTPHTNLILKSTFMLACLSYLRQFQKIHKSSFSNPQHVKLMFSGLPHLIKAYFDYLLDFNVCGLVIDSSFSAVFINGVFN